MIFNMKRDDSMKQVKRIEKMEKIYDKSEKILKELETVLDKFEKNRSDFQKLSKYYSSREWMEDFDDLNNNLLPKDLKCGILSEDAVYDLIGYNYNMAIRMLELGTNMVKGF